MFFNTQRECLLVKPIHTHTRARVHPPCGSFLCYLDVSFSEYLTTRTHGKLSRGLKTRLAHTHGHFIHFFFVRVERLTDCKYTHFPNPTHTRCKSALLIQDSGGKAPLPPLIGYVSVWNRRFKRSQTTPFTSVATDVMIKSPNRYSFGKGAIITTPYERQGDARLVVAVKRVDISRLHSCPEEDVGFFSTRGALAGLT